MTFSTFTCNLTRMPFHLKLSPDCWQLSWGENVVMCYRQSSEDAGPLSFDTCREQTGSAGPCALLRFSVMTLPLYSVDSLGLRKHIYSWWFLLPFVSSQGANQLEGGGRFGKGVGVATNSQLPFSWPFFLISRHMCQPAAEPVLNSAFSVFQELHNQNVHRTIALCLDTGLDRLDTALNLVCETLMSAWLEYILNQSMRRY